MIDELFLYLYACWYLGRKALAPESGPGANLWPSYRPQLLPTGDFSHSTTRSSLEPYHLVFRCLGCELLIGTEDLGRKCSTISLPRRGIEAR